MVSPTSPHPVFKDSQIKLDTLVRLRWLAILGQTLAVVFVSLGLGYDFQAVLCLGLIGLSAWLNLYLQFHFRKSVWLAPLPATSLLAYDSAQLGGLLYLTGGLQNPFALLLLVPAVVSATTQPARYTVFLAALITLIATLLVPFHQPLPWAGSTPPDMPRLYVVGIWIAVILTMLFLSAYAFRIAQESHQLSNALSATELILANEKHLTSLDGLATAAAHELGTPLSTIQLVAKELERELEADDPIREDIILLRSQAERCREILGKLRSLSGDEHNNFSKMRLKVLIGEIIEPFDFMDVVIEQNFPEDLSDQPVLWRNPGLLYGLGNLVENAVDFAKSCVTITARWTASTIHLQIADDGPGFADTVISRLGNPYVTTRIEKGPDKGPEGAESAQPVDEQVLALNGGGLGLGFFIAKTLLERSGGRVSISNKPRTRSGAGNSHKESSGAVIDIYWSRSALEADQ